MAQTAVEENYTANITQTDVSVTNSAISFEPTAVPTATNEGYSDAELAALMSVKDRVKGAVYGAQIVEPDLQPPAPSQAVARRVNVGGSSISLGDADFAYRASRPAPRVIVTPNISGRDGLAAHRKYMFFVECPSTETVEWVLALDKKTTLRGTDTLVPQIRRPIRIEDIPADLVISSGTGRSFSVQHWALDELVLAIRMQAPDPLDTTEQIVIPLKVTHQASQSTGAMVAFVVVATLIVIVSIIVTEVFSRKAAAYA